MAGKSQMGISDDRIQQLIDSGAREAASVGEPATTPLPSPGMVPGYEIIAELGRGGMGVVYHANQLATKRGVALKVMLSGAFASRSSRERFQREIELAARFQHPGIVRILEAGKTVTGQPFYTMDLVDGLSLGEWLLIAQPDATVILRTFEKICAAIGHAHAEGVLHRDLKPANVMINSDGEPMILDFGLSKALDTDEASGVSMSLSSPGQILGTLRYLSPEQADGAARRIDARADVYALGVMLYEALTGRLPFDPQGSATTIVQRICDSDPVLPSSLSRNVDRQLEAILMKTLDKAPHRRYATASELGADLRRYLDREPLEARPASSLELVQRQLRRQRSRIAATVASGVLIVAGLLGGFWLHARMLDQQKARGMQNARNSILWVMHDFDIGTDSAQEFFVKARAIRSNWPELPDAELLVYRAQYVAGRRAQDESRVNRTIAHLHANRDDPRLGSAYQLLLAEISRDINKPHASAMIAAASADPPETAEEAYLLSLGALDNERAIVFARKAVDIDARHTLARSRLAMLYYSTGAIDAALAESDTLISNGARLAPWLALQAKAYMKGRQYDQAIERAGRARKLNPNWDRPYLVCATAHLCLGNFDQSIEEFTATPGVEKAAIPWPRHHRATPLWITGRLDEAADGYRAVRRGAGFVSAADARLFLILHDDARRLEQSGDLAAAQRKREEAAQELRRTRNGTATPWLTSIIDCVAGKLAPAELVKLADTEDLEQMCEAYYYAAEACLLYGHQDEARMWYDRCVRTDLPLDPDGACDPMGEYHLANWRLATQAEWAALPTPPAGP